MSETTLDLVSQLTEVVTRYGLNIVGAVVLLILGWIAAAWARRIVSRSWAGSPASMPP